MSVAEPQWSQFGGFVAGPYFMLTELGALSGPAISHLSFTSSIILVELGSNKGTALLTSPLFSITTSSLESEPKRREQPESAQSGTCLMHVKAH